METGTARSSRKSIVLHPSFVDGLDVLSLDEVRRRRDEALAEREFQSYLRRLIQTRQDILMAERTRRQEGRPSGPLMDRLTAALSEGPKGGSGRGEAFRNVLSHADLEEAEREADALAGTAARADATAITDQELEQAVGTLRKGERTVSNDRAAVIRVHDRLQEELKRRYRTDPSQIPQEI